MRPIRDLFAAIFFVFFGLTVDPTQIPSVLIVAVPLAIVTAAAKGGVAWWGADREGVGRAGRRRAAAVLVARGEFSIVIAELGVAANIHDGLGPVSATYVLVLAIAGPLAARAVRYAQPDHVKAATIIDITHPTTKTTPAASATTPTPSRASSAFGR